LKHFQAAEAQAPNYAVLYNNLGELYVQKLHDRTKATAAYEKALAVDPSDYHYYVTLDRLYAEGGDQAKRDALYQKAPAEVKADFRVLLQRVHYLVDVSRYDEALALLQTHPWEGWVAGRVAYLRVLHGRADKAIAERRYASAVKDLQLAMEYPENLGVGKPDKPNHGCEYYKLGLCYKAQGQKDLAKQCFSKAAASVNEPSPGSADWHAKAEQELKELGG
jgi:tetratricopeptide (TPR) repeat protein